MSFPSVRAGIHANLRAYTDVTNVLGGMPTMLHRAPALITQFEGGTRVGQTNVFHWRFMLHAVMDQTANDIAESEIDEMVVAVHEALSPKLLDAGGRYRSQLGGAANTCWFEDVRSGEGDGYISFGEGERTKTYRRIAFVLVVKTMEAY
jgi:hypothetical protein